MLQVLADTDATPCHHRALELHEQLAAVGLEARTVALAPGRTGGLAHLVPAIAPSRRTLSALTQLRGEARWADVVVLHSSRSLPPFAGVLRHGPRLVLVLDDGEQPPTSRSARTLARTGAMRSVRAEERPSEADGWVALLTGRPR